MPRPSRFDPHALRRPLALSVWEGVCFAFMVGVGENYLVADALRLGASTFELGLVVTLPLLIGALGPLAALRALARIPRRRALAVTSSGLQAANWFVLAALDATGGNDPVVLIALASLHQLFGQATGACWTSWFGDLVPVRLRGRYFSRRNRWIYVSTCLGVLAGGGLLEWLEPERGPLASAGGRGFALLFLLAGLARAGSSALLLATNEPRFAGLAPRVRVLQFLRTGRGSRAWRLLVFSGTLYFSVYVASPYFTPYMLGELGFRYWEFMLASLAIVVFKVLSVPAWGRVIDGHGAYPTFALAALLTSLVPMPWLWTRGVAWAVLAQSFSGFSWAGYEVSLFALQLESSYRGTRPHVFAVQSLLHGSGQLLGGLVGAAALARIGDLRALFALSLASRLLLALLAPSLVPPPPRGPRVRKQDLLLRVIGLRPSGGIAHRPVTAEDEEREGL
jgi:MFS family permease